MPRRLLFAVVTSVLVALPFTVGAQTANAACVPSDTDPVVCVGAGGGAGLNVEIPGVIHVCLRLNSICP